MTLCLSLCSPSQPVREGAMWPYLWVRTNSAKFTQPVISGVRIPAWGSKPTHQRALGVAIPQSDTSPHVGTFPLCCWLGMQSGTACQHTPTPPSPGPGDPVVRVFRTVDSQPGPSSATLAPLVHVP